MCWQVGSHLKSPQLPIWVVLSESHFTCLFAGDRRLCQQQPEAGRFDLFYYDMLARQDDEIRLTVGQSNPYMYVCVWGGGLCVAMCDVFRKCPDLQII